MKSTQLAAQLSLPLPWGPAMAENSVATSVDLVVSDWAVDGAMSAQTLDKFALLAQRFVRFAAAHDVTTLDAVDDGLVAKFVAAKGRSRRGAVAPAAVATMHNRRAALRAYFRTARRLGLVLHDPTLDIDVPDRETASTRSLHDDEAVLVRLFSEHATPTRHAATTALLLAGAHTSELGHIRNQRRRYHRQHRLGARLDQTPRPRPAVGYLGPPSHRPTDRAFD
ncbi:Site-specific recombinase XerC [Mycobacteroides abscessus subsp. abscessus]|uniref:site-specific integrase n=1 Tax=Mycobacteroides abscessus TaxID=36809 RepID=UPI0009CD0FD3|nr:site-specific integrase [Mycobacteroides abscessus]SKF59986.1 Site-specific recombinase XerC [Mycobacteroides abscessus subsp. abscessus]